MWGGSYPYPVGGVPTYGTAYGVTRAAEAQRLADLQVAQMQAQQQASALQAQQAQLSAQVAQLQQAQQTQQAQLQQAQLQQQAAAAGQRLARVVLPPNVVPGQHVRIALEGQEYDVVCPPGGASLRCARRASLARD